MGVTTLPLDFDIFLRSGSRIHPDSAALCHGTLSCSKWARTTVENNHVRMMSWPCGRMSMGNVRAKRSGSSTQRHAICGVSDDVAQVSMMSGSPMNPPGCAALRLDVSRQARGLPDRWAACPRRARSVWRSPARPRASSGYHTGMGTPKNRWRLTSQSPLSPPTQLS